MICQGSRAVGMFSKISFVNTAVVEVFFVSTTGLAAVTVISSVTAPISIFMSIWAAKVSVMTTFWRVAFLKLASSNETVYVPIGTLGSWYAPVSAVTTVSGCCSVGPVTVTVTPGSTPPDASVTLPKIEPNAWAWADPAVSPRMPATSRNPRNALAICSS